MFDSLTNPLFLAGWLLIIWVGFMLCLEWAGNRRRARVAISIQKKEVDLLETKIESIRKSRQVLEDRSEGGWTGFANFIVFRKVVHGESGICSFYMKPKDRRLELPPFLPGQHLVFQLPVEGRSSALTRRYSLSDAPNGEYYRISVKAAQPPQNAPEAPRGLGSNWMHDFIQDQDTSPADSHLLVAIPQGGFHLQPADMTPVVLIGGGVGLTPILSMFNAILENNPAREVWLFYGVGNSGEDILYDEGMLHSRFFEITDQHENVHVNICYSRPLDRDTLLLESNPFTYRRGRIGINLLKRVLPSSNFHYYICGPGEMMDQLEEDLTSWGVPEASIRSERFGPAKKKPAPNSASGTLRFARSGSEAEFGLDDSCILDTAERTGVPIAYDCRSGSCGTCQVPIKAGKVRYPSRTSFSCPPGHALACCCVPDGDVVVDC